MSSNHKKWVTLFIFLLLFFIPKLNANSKADLVGAAESQDWSEMEALLESQDVNGRHSDGATAIHWAVHWNNLEIVKLLINSGANVNAANDHGVTPLFLASENRNLAIANNLLAAGADASAFLPAQRETVLMRAALSGSAEITLRLIEAGADPNVATSKSGQTALMWAISERHIDVISILLQANADIHAVSVGHFTPIMFAARAGNVDIAKLLIQKGATPNKTTHGHAPLVIAIEQGHVPMARFLLEEGADPNVLMDNGNRPLSASFAIGGRQRGYDPNAPVYEPPDKELLVRELLENGADPNGRRGVPLPGSRVFSPDGQASGFDRGPTDPDNFGVSRSWTDATPFWVAAHKADVNLMRVLLDAGADPSLTTADGTTALMVASGLSHAGDRYEKFWSADYAANAVEFLIEIGAPVNAVNSGGFTALHGAAFVGADTVTELLVKHGANINAQDFAGRTAFRIAQGHKGGGMSFVSRPTTESLLTALGADTTLGPHFNETEREEGLAVR